MARDVGVRLLALAAAVLCVASLNHPATPDELSFAHRGAEANPGLRFDLAEKGLEYGAVVGLAALQEEIKSVSSIPDISGNKDSFDYRVKNIKVSSATLGGGELKFEPNTGLWVTISDIDITLHADWSYKQSTMHFPSGSGSLKATVKGNSHISALIDLDIVLGRPSCKSDKITTHIDQLDISVSGSMFSWLYQLIASAFESDVKSELASQIDDEIKDLINNDLNSLLQSVNPNIALPLPAPMQDGHADMSMTTRVITDALLTLNSKGQLYFAKTEPDCPVVPTPISPPDPSVLQSKMASITISPYVVNSGLWSAFVENLLQYRLTPADIPPSVPIDNPLNTSTFELIAPEMFQKYPNEAMVLVMNASTVPVLGVDGNATSLARRGLDSDKSIAQVTTDTDFLFYVSTNNTEVYAFTLTCPLAARMEANITHETLHGVLTSFNCSLTLKDSAVGTVRAGMLNTMIQMLIKQLLIPSINKMMAGGLPIPTVEGLSFVNTTLDARRDGTLEVQTDVSYQTSSARQARWLASLSDRQARVSRLISHHV